MLNNSDLILINLTQDLNLNIFQDNFNILKLFVLNTTLNNTIVSAFLTQTLDLYYDFLITNNWAFMFTVNSNSNNTGLSLNFFFFIKTFIKINLFLFIIYMIFFVSYLENYIKQLISINSFTKLFILHESEKEVGPVDDFFFFAVLFILTLCSFIISSFLIILFHSSIFI
jgi:hypothetical protein